MKKKSYRKKLHKYLGIPMCFLLFMAALSGIITNHRKTLSSINVPRALLPKAYSYHNWNQGAIRGVLPSNGHYYLYGSAGVWLTQDSTLRSEPKAYNHGLPSGSDERKTIALTRDSHNKVWLATQYALYREQDQGKGWQAIALPQGSHERISDLQIKGDSLILLSRSHIYLRHIHQEHWKKYELKRADQHTEGMLLFQLMWAWHNGEYFGRLGQTLIDILGIITMLLSLTGIAYTLLNHRLRCPKLDKEQRKHSAQWLSKIFIWHNGWGRKLFWALLFVFVTGWCLRPPLMLPLIYKRLTPWKISHLYNDNPWHDRLRAIRYDQEREMWLLSTSVGFYHLNSFEAQPKKWSAQPQVSPMGINVLEQRANGEWLIGSFSGMWRVVNGIEPKVYDYFTGEPMTQKQSKPFGRVSIAGIKAGNTQEEDILFDYNAGAIRPSSTTSTGYTTAHLAPQPTSLRNAPFSLWQWALEVHTGRIYAPLIGRLGAEIFIFPFGLCAVLVLISGYKRIKNPK